MLMTEEIDLQGCVHNPIMLFIIISYWCQQMLNWWISLMHCIEKVLFYITCCIIHAVYFSRVLFRHTYVPVSRFSVILQSVWFQFATTCDSILTSAQVTLMPLLGLININISLFAIQYANYIRVIWALSSDWHTNMFRLTGRVVFVAETCYL